MPFSDVTHNELEIWYDGQDELRLELLLPNGTSIGTIDLGQNASLEDQGQTLIFVAHRRRDPNNQDNVIGVFLETGLPTGTWTMRLHGRTVTNGRYHAWIERDDDGQSSFVAPFDDSRTLGSVSCGHETIVVGSYDAHKPTLPLSFFSSAGRGMAGRNRRSAPLAMTS